MPTPSLQSGSSTTMTFAWQLGRSWTPGDQFSATLYAHSDTNDPNQSNNYYTVSAVVGVPIQFQSSPVSGFRVTVDGALLRPRLSPPPSTAPSPTPSAPPLRRP